MAAFGICRSGLETMIFGRAKAGRATAPRRDRSALARGHSRHGPEAGRDHLAAVVVDLGVLGQGGCDVVGRP